MDREGGDDGDGNGNGYVSVDALSALCENIGAGETVTKEDIENIVYELGDGNGSNSRIDADKMLKIIM